MQQALTAQANAYGASGQLSKMPGYLKPYLDQMYQPGGEFDPGGGFKPFTPSADKNLKQPNQATLDAFRADMEHVGPKRALEHLRSQGFDTSGLE
jgi:putative NADPH-quinone reductase